MLMRFKKAVCDFDKIPQTLKSGGFFFEELFFFKLDNPIRCSFAFCQAPYFPSS
jgi:hypothetical protein